MKKLVSLILVLIGFICNTWSQELFYLEENFEDAELISRWTNTPIILNKEWKYTYGGQWLSGGNPYNPEIPAQGNYNAGLYFPSLNLDTVKLISPLLELAGAGKPTLRFFHCQYEKVFKGPDHLRLLFRSSPSADWDLIYHWTSNIDFWKDEIFDIQDIDTKYLTDSFQLAFEGIIGNGYGVYVDSVTVKEDTIVQKFVKKITYKSVEYDVIPSRATNIPLEEIVIRILGNTGSAILDSITVVPTGTGLNYLEVNSFKLFCTNNSEQYAPYIADTLTLIATASLNAGKVTFKNISRNLLLGDNHLWVAASIKNTLKGQAFVRFSVPTNGIRVCDTFYPTSAVQFNENHLIKESVFYDDFESGGAGWTFEPNFEVGYPEGNLVGSQSNPETPFNGSNILATDLNGGYYPNIDSLTAYYAYMPELDLTYYINPSIYFQSYFAINGPDDAVIDYSIDGGSSWQNLWASDPSSNNSYWSEFFDQSINEIAQRQPQFQVRFGITESKTVPWPGFSIDNFAIISEKLHYDVGVTEILQPFNECLDCGNDTVQVWIRNYAVDPAPDTIPLFYGLWGLDSIIVRDTLFGGIDVNDSVMFTFSEVADFPIGDYYNKFIVGVDIQGDQDHSNDTLSKSLVIQNNYSPPVFENFEYKGGIWLPSENSTWTNKDMSGTITTDSLSPNIWVLSPTGNYRNSDTSYVESGCYDLSDVTRNIIQFKYWSDCEEFKDGARFEYTRNNGITWNILDDPTYSSLWGWPTNMVDALGTPGWSGINEWTDAKALLPVDIDSVRKAKFRLTFMSDAANSQAQGFAFNDLQIYPAPPDFGASSIYIPKDTCQFCTPDSVMVYVTNFGYNKLEVSDKMIIGIEVEGQYSAIDTFIVSSELLPGDSALFNVYAPMDVSTPGIYNVMAYTLMESDPFFYSAVSNDTVHKSFDIWQLPYGIAEDTISSRRPDTVVIRPYYDPNYEYLWDDFTTDSVYHALSSKTYYLTVTDGIHGCQYYDSILIELLFNDVGIDSIIWPQSQCELSNSEIVQVQIRNLGTDSLIIGDKIHLYYEIDGGGLVQDSVILTTPFHKGDTMWFSFTENSEDFSSEGDYSIMAYTVFGGDTIPENDTLFSTITVFGYPGLNLGSDTTIIGLTYLLDAAEPEFVSYLWSDADTLSSKLIDTAGYYWLDIIDEHGCPASDSIDIWFKIRDIRASSLISPVSECNRAGTDPVRVQIQNYGSDTVKIANDIYLSYKLDNNTRVNETIHINNLLPGATYLHTFVGTVNLTAFDDYNFNITATTPGDLRTNNDTMDVVVYTNTNPVVNFGIIDYEPIKATQYVFDAGYNPNYTYLWHDGSKNQTYTATNIGQVRVVVTDTLTGCTGGDTVYLYLDILDYMISAVGISSSTCEDEYNNVTLSVLNNGNLPRGAAEFSLRYMLGNTVLFTENYDSTGLWPAGAIRTYYTEHTIDLSESGIYQLKVIIDHAEDLRPENDTLKKTITVMPNPVIDFGGPSLTVQTPYILDAGSGHSSYLWSNGSTNSTLTVTQGGTYSVTVTGTNGCLANQQVIIQVGTSVSEIAANQMKVEIYPNPASEYITLNADFEIAGEYILEIYDTENRVLSSQMIYDQKFTDEIYVGDLLPGMYFIRIRNDKMYHISKLIVK